MEWQKLTETLYFKDGSLRDIYIHNTLINDWEKWIDYVNNNYSLKFYNKDTDRVAPKIDINEVIKYWNKENKEGLSASIDVFGINLMCYFFVKTEIEVDFNPNDIRSITDHLNLINYLRDCSIILQKQVIVSAEMQEEEILLTVLNGEVLFQENKGF